MGASWIAGGAGAREPLGPCVVDAVGLWPPCTSFCDCNLRLRARSADQCRPRKPSMTVALPAGSMSWGDYARPEERWATAAAMAAETGHVPPAPCGGTAVAVQIVETRCASYETLMALTATTRVVKATVEKMLEPPPRAPARRRSQGPTEQATLTSSSSDPTSLGSIANAPRLGSDASAATSGQSW